MITAQRTPCVAAKLSSDLLCMLAPYLDKETLLSFVSGCSRLLGFESLDLSGCLMPAEIDLVVFRGLPRLRSLHLRDCGIADVSFLSELTHLEALCLSENGIREFSPIGCLMRLQRLTIGNCGVTDISFLEGLINLVELDLSYEDQIKDFSPLSRLTGLQQLLLGYCGITDIRFLADLTKLSTLSLEGNSKIRENSPLRRLTCLRDLDLRYCCFGDFSFLEAL